MTAPAKPSLGQYLATWLADVVRPNLEPATYTYYEALTRLYIVPSLGTRPLDLLQASEVQAWLNDLATTCQCWSQGKDQSRPPGKQRCCAHGDCCKNYPGRRTIQAARNTLRAALNHAQMSDQLVPRNVARYAEVPSPPCRRTGSAWSAEEAIRFLASARADRDPFYAAYELILVGALHRGEVLGLKWGSVDTERRQIDISWQLQRVSGQLIHKQRAMTGNSDAEATVPLPEIGLAALEHRRRDQAAARERAGQRWQDSDLVFTTRWGTPVEPRNFYRSFEARCRKASVPRIRLHDTRGALKQLSENPDATTPRPEDQP